MIKYTARLCPEWAVTCMIKDECYIKEAGVTTISNKLTFYLLLQDICLYQDSWSLYSIFEYVQYPIHAHIDHVKPFLLYFIVSPFVLIEKKAFKTVIEPDQRT